MLSEERLIAMCGQPKSKVFSFKSFHSSCLINVLSFYATLLAHKDGHTAKMNRIPDVSEFYHSQPLMRCYLDYTHLFYSLTP